MQAQHAELMDWDGRRFPVGGDGGQGGVPEAFRCEEGVLPHMHQDVELRFPKAIAGEALEDMDPPDNSSLEERGTRRGKDGVRFR